jgi:hypothetical protein
MNKTTLTSAAAVLVLALAGLNAQAQNVAIVNGKPVPKTRLTALATQLERSGKQVGPEMEQQLREEVIAREIFMQEAQTFHAKYNLLSPESTYPITISFIIKFKGPEYDWQHL